MGMQGTMPYPASDQLQLVAEGGLGRDIRRLGVIPRSSTVNSRRTWSYPDKNQALNVVKRNRLEGPPENVLQI